MEGEIIKDTKRILNQLETLVIKRNQNVNNNSQKKKERKSFYNYYFFFIVGNLFMAYVRIDSRHLVYFHTKTCLETTTRLYI